MLCTQRMLDRDSHADILDQIDPDLGRELRDGACGYYELPVEIRVMVADLLDAARTIEGVSRRRFPRAHRGGR